MTCRLASRVLSLSCSPRLRRPPRRHRELSVHARSPWSCRCRPAARPICSCRLAADKAGAILGQQIVIENRAGGAGGRVGTETVMRSAPDGYTLLCAPQLNYSITHLVFTKSSFDTRGMEPVSVLATYPLTVLARGNFPADDLPGFIAYAKANPDKVNYGHQGKGNTGHLLGELLMLKGGFKMAEVPYRGPRRRSTTC